MSQTIITKEFYGEGKVLIDPASVVLMDFTGAFGVKRLDTDEVVVPAGAYMTKVSTGVYQFAITDPAPNLQYEYWVQAVIQGSTYYWGGTVNSASLVAGYTLEDLIDRLGNMLNELNQAGDQPFEYTPQMGLGFLLWGQRRLLSMIPMSYFDMLHEKLTGIALDAGGAFTLASITPAIWEKTKGIQGVQHVGGMFANRISFEEYRKFKDARMVFNANSPVCYLRGGKVFIEPFSTGDTASLYWMREPARMALDPYGEHGYDTQCELSEGLQDILLDLAAWRGYVIGNSAKRGETFLAAAADGIAALTGRETPTDTIRESIDRSDDEWDSGYGLTINQYIP